MSRAPGRPRRGAVWLLDPDREVPGDMPRTVADVLHDGDSAALELWAAFSWRGH
ncbi:hypothetical protein [Streptomyces sp. NPDC088261]|uniref:hypothetical protein n=1 Tax=Streptomyces sp. NPDC088261 TaxID=3365851 RepID=UPI0037F851AD